LARTTERGVRLFLWAGKGDAALGALSAFVAADFRAAWELGFALLGESLFPGAEKVTKNALPLHPALRFAPGSFTTPPLRGSPYKGHPRLSPHPCGSPLSTTASFTLLKGHLESPESLCTKSVIKAKPRIR